MSQECAFDGGVDQRLLFDQTLTNARQLHGADSMLTVPEPRTVDVDRLGEETLRSPIRLAWKARPGENFSNREEIILRIALLPALDRDLCGKSPVGRVIGTSTKLVGREGACRCLYERLPGLLLIRQHIANGRSKQVLVPAVEKVVTPGKARYLHDTEVVFGHDRRGGKPMRREPRSPLRSQAPASVLRQLSPRT